MDKRRFLTGTAILGAASSAAFGQTGKHSDKTCAGAPTLLTLSGAITRNNRGALDPTFDQLLAKQHVTFSAAYTFDFPALTNLPAVTMTPTLEYDARKHTLRGPLLADVLDHAGAPRADDTKILLRAIDGYAVVPTLANVRAYRFIVATHLDSKPMALGGLGPLWAVYDADNIPELAAKPLIERFVMCPWALYYIQVMNA